MTAQPAVDSFDLMMPPGEPRNRESCIAAMNTAKVKELLRRHIREQEKMSDKDELKDYGREDLLRAFGFCALHEIFMLVALLLTFILVALRADKKLNCNWDLVLIPLLYPLIIFVARPVLFFLMENCTLMNTASLTRREEGWSPNVIGSLPHKAFTLPSGRKEAVMYFTFIASGVFAFLLFYIKMSTESPLLPWTVIFSFVALDGIMALAMTVFFRKTCFFSRKQCGKRSPAVIPLISFIVTCFFIGLRMDDVISPGTDWNLVFLPLYFTMASMAVIPILYFANSRLFSTFNKKGGTWGAIGAVLLFFVDAPGFAFLVGVANLLNGNADTNHVLLFTPIFVQCVATGFFSGIFWGCTYLAATMS